MLRLVRVLRLQRLRATTRRGGPACGPAGQSLWRYGLQRFACVLSIGYSRDVPLLAGYAAEAATILLIAFVPLYGEQGMPESCAFMTVAHIVVAVKYG